jgi:hypothetical protein
MAFKTYKPTKADLMRAFIAQCRAEGKIVRPKEIIDEMARNGITISSGQASVVLRKFNKRRRTVRATAKVSPNGTGACAIKKTKEHDGLMLASQFARNCGSISQAKKMLAALEQIVDPFVRS